MPGVCFLSRKNKSICSACTQSAIFAVFAVWITALVFSKGVLTNTCFNDAVGVADPNSIPDNQFTASSHYNFMYYPYYGRLNGNRGDGWCAASNDGEEWLQVDLGKTFQICGVATQGDVTNGEWTTVFKLSYSTDGSGWTIYLNATDGAEMEFHRQSDSLTVEQHILPLPMSARYIRFYPTQQHNYRCLRVEVYGTAVSTNACFNDAVGVADPGIIPDNQFTAASTDFSDTVHPYYGRLNDNRGDGWCPATCCGNQDWLQVDLRKTFQICGVATQGDVKGDGWTEDFKLSYSSDGSAWTTSLNTNGTEMEFQRPGDSYRIGQHILPVPVTARYVRFRPTKQHYWNCLRVEVYGTAEVLDNCRTVQFTPPTKDRVLENHVIRRMQVPNKDKCELGCYHEPNCVSYNYGPTGSEASFCELNDRTHFQVPNGDLSSKQGYIYRHILNLCQSNPCLNNATCQAGFTNKGYRCICPPSHRGDHCETDVDECITGSHVCPEFSNCANSDGSYDCNCWPGYQNIGLECVGEDNSE